MACWATWAWRCSSRPNIAMRSVTAFGRRQPDRPAPADQMPDHTRSDRPVRYMIQVTAQEKWASPWLKLRRGRRTR